MKLTTGAIRSLRLPAGKKDHIEWDDEIAGFGVRLREGGSATYVFQYAVGDRQRRMSLGSTRAIDFGPARNSAKDLYAKVRLGGDPAGEKAEAQQKAAETFGVILPRFLAYQQLRVKPRSYGEIERHLLRQSRSLHGLQLAKIRRSDIAAVTSAVAENSGDRAANTVRSSLSSFFAWAMGEGLVDLNPVIGTTKREEKTRNRVLRPEELRLVWTHAGGDQYGAIIKLLALTGARLSEIASLRWSEIHDDMIVLPPHRVKNGRGHEIFVTTPAREILDTQPRRTNRDGTPRDLIFGRTEGRPYGGWNKAKRQLDERIAQTIGKPLTPFTHHDLRRSFSTHANEIGIAPHIVEACLGHISGFRAGVAGRYIWAAYRSETRRALERWAEQLLAWVAGRESNVITLSQLA